MTSTPPVMKSPAERAQQRRLPVKSWSRRRQVTSSLALAVVLIGAGLFTWRATATPLHLWVGNKQCSTLPERDVGQLFGLALSRDLDDVRAVQILDITSTAWGGASTPKYWIVPITDGSAGTGSAGLDDPPPNWANRRPAIGSALIATEPANLLAELSPRNGHAALLDITVTYRTPDGFTHTATGNPGAEVDTTGACTNSTGS